MKKLFITLSGILFMYASEAEIIHIPADYPTIQQGIDAAGNSDTVLVQPDTYFENINFNGKEITVASLFLTTQDTTYISETVIDGNQSGSVVTFENQESANAVLSGFTITNGNSTTSGGGIMCVYSSPTLHYLNITDNEAQYNGGGIICGAFASPDMDYVTIVKNTAGGDGGGMYCFNNCNPRLENVVISSNSAANGGGGICCLESCYLILNIVTIENNSANQGGGILSASDSDFIFSSGVVNKNSATKGGGIYMTQNSPVLSDLEISYNQANLAGGIFCDNANPVMNNLKIIGNMSTNKGGGISLYQSSPVLKNIIIQDNVAYIGGGVFCLESNPSLINVLVNNNQALIESEGIGGGIALLNSNSLLVNVSMTNNYAGNFGGGIYLSMNSEISLSSCILWNNNPIQVYFDPNSGTDTLTVSYSDTQGGTDSIITNNHGEVVWLAGNINQDPLFVDSGDFPFQINDFSPCIDAGTPDTMGLNLPEYDLAGEIRIFNNRVDMGAYEWNTFVGFEESGKTNSEISCYPNPFTSSITIEYELNKTSVIQLYVYDYLGKLMDRMDLRQTQGKQQIKWNAEGLPTGMYYSVLTIDFEPKTMKMIKLK